MGIFKHPFIKYILVGSKKGLICYNTYIRGIYPLKGGFFVLKKGVSDINTIEFKTLLKRTGFPQETEKVLKLYEERIGIIESRIIALEAILAKIQQKS